MKCNLSLLQQNNITCSFLTLFIGVKYNLLDRAEIENYTTHYLLQNPEETDFCIPKLAFLQKNENDIAFLISQALTKKEKNIRSDSQEWFIEKRKLIADRQLPLSSEIAISNPKIIIHDTITENIEERKIIFDLRQKGAPRTILIKNNSKKSSIVMQNLFNALAVLPDSMRKSLTFDNGMKISC
jgi:hypothetical protein